MVRTFLTNLKLRLARWFIWLMPTNIRRMVFLLSVVKIMRNESPISDTLLEKLNTTMKLSERDGAMRVSLLLSEVVWAGKTATEVCGGPLDARVTMDQEQIESIFNSISKQTPKELTYAPISEIRKDVGQLLRMRELA